MLKRFWNRVRTAPGASRGSSARRAPRHEASRRWDALEARQMLTAAPTDYVLSGDSWSNPGRITYSYPLDGTAWDGGYDNLNAMMNSEFQGQGWVRQFAKALQTWASVANINVVPVADASLPFNTFGLYQGDPRFGDIRVGGYNFQSSTVLAQSYNPPPNGVTGAGDVEVNTGFNWGPGASYDFYSVMLHETGLALGLGETTDPTAVMNRVYGGVRTGLEPVDVAGIQAIYGPRTADPLQILGQATAPSTAFDLTGMLRPYAPGQALAAVGGVSLDAVGDTEYFSVTAPASGSAETLVAVADAKGISSLSPAVTIYDASMRPIASASNPAFWGDGVIAAGGGIVPGGRYIVAVTGATGDVFSVGSYNFQVQFKGITGVVPPPVAPVPPTPVPPPPVVPPPPPPPPVSNPGPPSATSTPPAWPPTRPQAPSIPKDRFEPNNDVAHAVDLGAVASRVVAGLTIYAPTDVQVFSFVAPTAGTVAVATGTTKLWVVNGAGQTVASGIGGVSFANATPGARYWIGLGSADGQGNPGFSLGIVVTPKATTSPQVIPARVVVGVPTPTPTPSPSPTPSIARAAISGAGRPPQLVPVATPRWIPLT